MVQYIFLFINKFYLSFFIYFLLLTKYPLIKSIGVWPDTFNDNDQIFTTNEEVFNINKQYYHQFCYYTTNDNKENNNTDYSIYQYKYGIYYDADTSCVPSGTIDYTNISNSFNDITTDNMYLFKRSISSSSNITCDSFFPVIQKITEKKYIANLYINTNQASLNLKIKFFDNNDENDNCTFTTNSKKTTIKYYCSNITDNKGEYNFTINNNLTPETCYFSLDADLKIKYFLEDSNEIILSHYEVYYTDIPDNSNTKDESSNCEIDTNIIHNNNCHYKYMCNGINCVSCHTSCFTCSSDNSNGNAKNSCTKCTSLTDNSIENGVCNINYIDLTKYHNISIPFSPPLTNNRVTLGFWTFIPFIPIFNSNKNELLIHVVVDDFLVITIYNNVQNINAYCVSNELINSEIKNKLKFNEENGFKEEIEKENIKNYTIIKENILRTDRKGGE